MAPKRLSRIEWVVVIGVVVVLVALLIPQPVAVWGGRTRLTILIDEEQPIDHGSLRLAYSWREKQAESSLSFPNGEDRRYSSPERDESGALLFDIPTSGRVGYWGRPDTYNHPEHLLVEYLLASDEEAAPKRKRFPIPKARGPRELRITLP